MKSRLLINIILLLLGLLLLAFALIATPARVEVALIAQSDGRLSWGPTLFRWLLVWHGILLLTWGLTRLLSRPKNQINQLDSILFTPSKASKRLAPYVAMAGILVLAVVLRFWQLGTCLWYDEIATFVEFLRLPYREIVSTFPSQNQHMFYSVLGHTSFVLFGESATTARLPALFFGVASILALFLYARRTNGTREALLACLLMAVSYHHVWFSQNARGYTGVLFFTILATWLFFEAISNGKTRWWIAYMLALTFGLWTHLTMGFVVAAHGLVYLVSLVVSTSRRETDLFKQIDIGYRWKAMLAWVTSATLTLQLYAVSLPEFFASALHEKSVKSDWTNPSWIIEEAIRRLGDVGATGLIVMAGFVVLMIGFASLARRDWRVAVLMVLPAVLGGATMIALGHNLWPRFFFFCMGFFILLAVRGATVVGYLIAGIFARNNNRDRTAQYLGTVFTLIVILGSVATLPRCYAFPKQDYLGARAYVEQQWLDGDGVVAVGLARDAYRAYYAPHWQQADTLSDLVALSKQHKRLWVVYTLTVQLEAWYPKINSVVLSQCDDKHVFRGTLGGGDVVVCQLNQAWKP